MLTVHFVDSVAKQVDILPFEPRTCTLRNGFKMRVRRATSADYDDVMSIGRFYDGRDYMPGLYTVLCESGEAHVFIGYVSEQCVSSSNDEFCRKPFFT